MSYTGEDVFPADAVNWTVGACFRCDAMVAHGTGTGFRARLPTESTPRFFLRCGACTAAVHAARAASRLRRAQRKSEKLLQIGAAAWAARAARREMLALRSEVREHLRLVRGFVIRVECGHRFKAVRVSYGVVTPRWHASEAGQFFRRFA